MVARRSGRLAIQHAPHDGRAAIDARGTMTWRHRPWRSSARGKCVPMKRAAPSGGRPPMIPREMVAMMERRRLVAEIRTATAVQALGVVDALAAAGIAAMEISLTIPGAQEILTHLAPRRDVLIGAGAVLDTHQA